MSRLLILFIGVTCLLYSCHPAKKIQTPVAIKDTITAVVIVTTNHSREDSIAFIKKTYKDVLNNYINFTTFSGKIDLDYEDAEGKKLNVNAHVRMYKDSIIWLSITGPLGIEGLRAYITRDSVKMINKQDKIYTARSVSFLQEVTALPLDLPTLQDLLLGNPVFLDSNITSYSKTATTISLQNNGASFNNLITAGETDKLVQSIKLDDPDLQRNRTCYLTYTDYENKKGTDGYQINFSTRRGVHITGKKKMDIKMYFKQYNFNEKLSFPFSVPKNYTQN